MSLMIEIPRGRRARRTIRNFSSWLLRMRVLPIRSDRTAPIPPACQIQLVNRTARLRIGRVALTTFAPRLATTRYLRGMISDGIANASGYRRNE